MTSFSTPSPSSPLPSLAKAAASALTATATPLAPASQIRLTQLRPGQTGVISSTTLDVSDAALLKAMGLCDQARVRLCRVGEPCVVAVGGVGPLNSTPCGCGGSCRIGLARPLADQIFVIPGV